MEIRAQDLCVARGGVPVLQGVSFHLKAGEALVLRGPNGCGKTTLLRSIVGLQPLVSGHLDIPNEACAYAAHADGLKSMLTVTENLRFWAEVYGAAPIDTALAAFDLGALAHRFAGQLSAGQKRRLGLARLLVTGRPVWVLDEPTVSLDATAQAQFMEALSVHLGQGGLAILSTHVSLDLLSQELDLAPFRADPQVFHNTSDEAFL